MVLITHTVIYPGFNFLNFKINENLRNGKEKKNHYDDLFLSHTACKSSNDEF